jgi:hypothetical protein
MYKLLKQFQIFFPLVLTPFGYLAELYLCHAKHSSKFIFTQVFLKKEALA